MAFVRRSRRIDLIMGVILTLLILNLIYFQRIELKLDSAKYLSNISMGSSDRIESNGFLWPSFSTSPSGYKQIFFSPETLKQSIQREEKNLTVKRKSEHLSSIDYSIITTRPPTCTIEAPLLDTLKLDKSRHQKNRQRLLKKEFEEVDDFDNEAISLQTTPEPTVKPHPLKKPRIEEINLETKHHNEKIIQTAPEILLCSEIPPNLIGKIELDTNEESIDDVQKKLSEILYPGGYYGPAKCQARYRVAIIVPYRNQPKNLAIFLKNIHPFLMKQQLEYGVFVVEQTVGSKFNRGMLLNVGYLEAEKIKKWDCFIFHNVDLLPVDDRILYTCSKNPRHLAVSVDILPSHNTLSGALAITSEQFERINGYSNLFWGWGYEDLDLANRLKNASYKVDRCHEKIARYTMLGRDPVEPNVKRLDLLREGPTKFKTIGLNSIKYTVQCIDESPAYTWLFVTLKPEVPGDESNVEQLGVK
ncbi:beta-1,4-galactosyltransferase 4-like [Sitodiplosis mosellana]|uniref:beta-1,4-galactosyltransferase 4-like n=1 Tax=Sitodiplosis mosellana TaxID=263140 RepID=UPI0024444406|nr:beta-1,4-galactosyltransferase 4-like [Sitodiplosis mosellana]